MKLIGYYHPESESAWCIDCDNGDFEKGIIFMMEVVPIYNDERRANELVCDQCGRKFKKINEKEASAK